MEHKKKKELRIRSCLTGAIWLALAFSMLISALLFAFLNHFLDLPGKIPGLGWLLIFNTLIAGLITSFINARLLEPITRLSKAMKAVSQGDFEQHVETNSRIAEIGESYQSFNVMTKELRATEMLQMDFVSNVSHEFKTPIVSISGFADLLLDEEVTPEEQREYLQIIRDESRRLAQLSGSVLLLNRIEAQTILTDCTDFSLDEQLRQCILVTRQKWRDKPLQFEAELAPCTYHGSEALVKEIWLNLLDNAAKFSPENGTISVTLHCEQGRPVVAVTDHGCGMDAETCRHIFEQFYQGDTSHRTQGNGSGLAMAQKIAALHGGAVTVDSRPGSGSCFTVVLK